MLSVMLGEHLAGSQFSPPKGPPGYQRSLAHDRRPYATLDGHICVLVYNDKHWRAFFSVIGKPEIFETDARFQSQSQRLENIDHVYGFLSDVIGTRTTAYWLEVFDKADIPAARMYAIQAEGCAPIVRAFDNGERHAELWKNASTAAAGMRVPVAIGDYLILDAVRQSGGTVGITSELGKGTTFTIYLPRLAEDSDSLKTTSLTTSQGERSETILLVEDNDMVRGLAHTVLVAQHYHVVAARSGEEALRLVRNQGRHIALLVTDMVMPGMGGAQLASELQALQPELKVILTSGYSERDSLLLQHFDARMAFLPKPYTPESLTKAVAAALESPAQQEAYRDTTQAQ